jgi:hypothetical protein
MTILLALSIFSQPTFTSASTPIDVYIEGYQLQFDQPPIIKSGRTLVPFRVIFEELGADVTWDNATRTVTATRNDKVIKLKIGSLYPTINGQVNKIDVPSQILNSRTLVPLRFVSESLGADVEWVERERDIYITIFEPFYDKYFETTFSGDVIYEYNENEFINKAEILELNQEIVNTTLYTSLLDPDLVFIGSQHYSVRDINGKHFGIYLSTFGELVKNGHDSYAYSDYAIEIYDLEFDELAGTYEDSFENIAFSQSIYYSTMMALRDVGIYSN